jgi:tRNA A-37 threonylcarbamoyl transferase component Bud32
MQITNTNIYVKNDVDLHEYNMHNYIQHLDIVPVPKVIDYNIKTKQMKMEKIQGMSVADFYGESFESVPEHIIQQIRQIIQKLKSNNIIYPDITGYNFIESNGKVWVIDFEHTRFCFGPTQSIKFVNNFIDGIKSWNPDFK